MLAQNVAPDPWSTTILPILSLLVTVLNLIVTVLLVRVTRRYADLTESLVKTTTRNTDLTESLVRVQTEPYVVVYVHHDMSLPSMLQIVIENLGRGIAEDVEFALSARLPMRAFGRDEATASMPVEMNIGPLINGIPTLGPGAKRTINWGEYGGLHKFLQDKTVTVDARCKFGSKKIPVVRSTLEVASFVIENATDTGYTRQSVEQLTRIAKALEDLATSNPLPDGFVINSDEIEGGVS
jgi:hypothetical protein